MAQQELPPPYQYQYHNNGGAIDNALTLQAMQIVQNVFGDGNNGSILKLVFLTSLDGVKRMIASALMELAKKETMMHILSWGQGALQWIVRLLNRRRPLDKHPSAATTTTIEFQPHPQFWVRLLNNSNVAIAHNVSRTKVHHPDLEKEVVIETWQNVHVTELETGLEAYFDTPLDVTFSYKHQGQREVDDVNSSLDIMCLFTSEPGQREWHTWVDLIPYPEFREDVKQYCLTSCACKDNSSIGVTINGIFTPAQSLKMLSAYHIYLLLERSSHMTPRPGTHNQCFMELYLLLSVLNIYPTVPAFTKFTSSMAVQCLANGHHPSVFGMRLTSDLQVRCIGLDSSSSSIVQNFREVSAVRAWLLKQIVPVPTTKEEEMGSRSSVLNVNVLLVPTEEADVRAATCLAWREFVTRVMSNPCTNVLKADDAINVHIVGVKTESRPMGGGQPLPNPAFKDWEDRRDAVQALVKESPLAAAQFSAEPVPSRTLPQPTVEHSVVTAERVNTASKSLSTLYLPHEDMRRLRASVELFMDRGDRMKALGLPHKLNILLHGAPGTGKTSTLTALATYMRKDIYYLQLGGVRTCGELRLLFEHVTKNCTGGGMIVCEDIDVMTPVVLRRETSGVLVSSSSSPPPPPSSNAAAVGNDGPLTLEFMLNLLQGVLTMDGTIFAVTTNCLDALDPAFYRPGRFDILVHLGPCNRDQVVQAFTRFMDRPPSPHVIARVQEGVHTTAAVVARLAQYVCIPPEDIDDEQVLAPFLVPKVP